MTIRMLQVDDDHDRIKITEQSTKKLDKERHTRVRIYMIRVFVVQRATLYTEMMKDDHAATFHGDFTTMPTSCFCTLYAHRSSYI